MLTKITRWAIIITGIIVALQQVDFDVTAFLAGLGVVGFTLGFAVQDVSKNFIAGLLLSTSSHSQLKRISRLENSPAP